MAENPKSHDQAFKHVWETDTRAFLDINQVLAASEEADVELLRQEISVPPAALDAGCIIRQPGQSPRVVVFEALSKFMRESLDRVRRYGTRLVEKYDMPVYTYMVPLVQRACPLRPPRLVRLHRGGVHITVDLNWIRPWEIDAALLLKKRLPAFDAWSVLCRTTEPQLREAFRRLKAVPEEAARMRILGGLRYRGSEAGNWFSFVERMNQMLTRDDMRESLAVQEWLAEGREEGREAGELAILNLILSKRFPSLTLPAGPYPDGFLARLAERLIVAADEPAARRILAATRSPAKAQRPRPRPR